MGSSGLWLKHKGMEWGYSGHRAFGANLLVSAGQSNNTLCNGRRESLMKWMSISKLPIGWIIWPDEHPDKQKVQLSSYGFKHLTTHTLMSCSVHNIILSESVKLVSTLQSKNIYSYAKHLVSYLNIPKEYAIQVASGFLINSQQGYSKTWLIITDGEPRSSITAFRERSWGGLAWLGTQNKYRRRGYAKELANIAISWLISKGAAHLEIQSSIQAVELYQRMGFKSWGKQEFWGNSSNIGNKKP